jgi:hypothetical protein
MVLPSFMTVFAGNVCGIVPIKGTRDADAVGWRHCATPRIWRQCRGRVGQCYGGEIALEAFNPKPETLNPRL